MAKSISIFKSHRRVIDTHEVYLHEAGRNNPRTLVLVHGIGVSSAYFHRFARRMSNYYRVVMVDLPGYGMTRRPPNALSVQELARVLRRLIDQENYGKVVLVGHSMGCQIVTNLLSEYPLLYSKYILLSPTTYDKERTVRLQAWRLLQNSFREPFLLTMRMIRDYVRMGTRLYFQTLRYMLDDRIERRMPNCLAEGLVIRGEHDPIVPRQWVTRLAKLAPHARYVELSGASHVVQYNKAAELAAVCRKFIEE